MASGRKITIYGCFRGQELCGGLPLVCSFGRLGIKCGHSPLLTPYLGVVFKDNNAKYITVISINKRISKAIAAKIKDDFDSIRFHFTPFLTDLQPFIWEGFSTNVRYTYLLDLKDLDYVWQCMDAKRRNDITRAKQDGIYVDSNGHFDEMFALVENTFERQKMQPRFALTAFRYNEVLSQKGDCKCFLARNKDGKAIAGVYIVWDEKSSYYLLGGYDAEESHHGASATAMWEAIKFTKRELGLNQFDFEGSMIPQIEQYFRKFGGRLAPYYSVSWIRPSIMKPFRYLEDRYRQFLRVH